MITKWPTKKWTHVEFHKEICTLSKGYHQKSLIHNHENIFTEVTTCSKSHREVCTIHASCLQGILCKIFKKHVYLFFSFLPCMMDRKDCVNRVCHSLLSLHMDKSFIWWCNHHALYFFSQCGGDLYICFIHDIIRTDPYY